MNFIAFGVKAIEVKKILAHVRLPPVGEGRWTLIVYRQSLALN
jgi:hypothetical protein